MESRVADRAELIAALEEEHALLGLEAPPGAEHWSRNALTAYFASDGEALPSRPSAPWIHPKTHRAGPPGTPRLFCLHAAGSSSGMFRGWQDQVGPAWELVAVELPGHGSRPTDELPVAELPVLVDQLVAAFFPSDAAFALLGVSAGALLAYELARELGRRGLEPPIGLLVLSEEEPLVLARGSTCQVRLRPELPISWEPDGQFKQDLLDSPLFDLDPELLESSWGVGLMRRCRAALLWEDFYYSQGGEIGEDCVIDCSVVAVWGSKDTNCYRAMTGWCHLGAVAGSYHQVEGGEHLFMQQPSSKDPVESKVYMEWMELFRAKLGELLQANC